MAAIPISMYELQTSNSLTSMYATLSMMLPSILLLFLANVELDTGSYRDKALINGILAVVFIELVTLFLYTSLNDIFMLVNAAIIGALLLATYIRTRRAPAISVYHIGTVTDSATKESF